MKSILGFFFFISSLSMSAQISEFIHVDQFGYLPNQNKVAVLSNPEVGFNSSSSYTPGSTIELRNYLTDAVVYSASPQVWGAGVTHQQSGDKGWWFDFSSITAPGTYYVFDPTNNEATGSFEINTNPYSDVLKSAVKMFYYNRCNDSKDAPYADASWTDGTNFLNPLQDANCRFIFDPNNAALEKELSGGWFDAGDYNKYITFAQFPIHELLASYEDNPVIFGDDWNWPTSGNGIPDLLDEVIWELDWMQKMTNSDGSVHIKMGSQNHSENISAPPSANVDQRFYGNTCTSASVSVASVFAHAALVLQNQPGLSSYAANLLATSENCWAYFKTAFDSNSLETNCDNGEIISGDADKNANEQLEYGMTAAIYLFELTGKSVYQNFIIAQHDQIQPISNNFYSPYAGPYNESLLRYSQLPNADSNVADAIIDLAIIAVNNNDNNFYQFVDSDLYRGQSPDWMYHWGSNLPKAGIANLSLLMRKYNVVPSMNNVLLEKAYEQMHYFHGVNPFGMVQLSNMYGLGGDRCVNEIYHTWFNDNTIYDNAITSPNGPAPGFVTGGVNKDFTVASISPPSGQPILKSYLDFNDGYPSNSWEITEPAIYYQASYIRMLTRFVNTDNISSGINVGAFKSNIEIFPNPVDDHFRIRGLMPNYTIKILDSSGTVYAVVIAQGAEATIDTSTLPSGMFFVTVEHNNHGPVSIQKIIKAN